MKGWDIGTTTYVMHMTSLTMSKPSTPEYLPNEVLYLQ